MSYEKLDIKDFVDKWDVSKVRHLEDTIIENEKAVGEAIASINFPADWNQSDENAPDFIKNKPFYSFQGKVFIYTNETYIEDDYLGGIAGWCSPEVKVTTPYTLSLDEFQQNNFYIDNELIVPVFINDEESMIDAYYNNKKIARLNYNTSDLYFYLNDYHVSTYHNTYYTTLKIEKMATFYETLDDNYIPKTIARLADLTPVGNNIKNINKTVSSLERVSRYITSSDWYLKIDTINNTVTVPIGLLMSGTWSLPITEQTVDISQEYDTTLVVYDSSTSAICNISCTDFVAESMYIIAIITRNAYDKPNYNQIQGPYMVDGVMINSMAHTTTTVIDDIITTPTAEQFNALLQVLRDAGILATD